MRMVRSSVKVIWFDKITFKFCEPRLYMYFPMCIYILYACVFTTSIVRLITIHILSQHINHKLLKNLLVVNGIISDFSYILIDPKNRNLLKRITFHRNSIIKTKRWTSQITHFCFCAISYQMENATFDVFFWIHHRCSTSRSSRCLLVGYHRVPPLLMIQWMMKWTPWAPGLSFEPG